jgi:DNA-binding NarL/FixJ family response regulator
MPKRMVAVLPSSTDHAGDACVAAVNGAPAARTVKRVIVGSSTFLEREGIARVIDGASDVNVVAWAASEEETLRAVKREAPDVLVVNVPMAPTHTDEGVRLAYRLRQDYPAIGVVALGPGIQPQYAVRLFAPGARGRAYLLAGRLSSGDELLGAIREVALGGVVVDPAVVETLVGTRQAIEGLLGRLTARELEVLSLVADGLSNAGVAEQLSLTKRGVEKHIGEIFARFRLQGRLGVSPRVVATLVFLQEAGRLVDNQTGGSAPPAAAPAGTDLVVELTELKMLQDVGGLSLEEFASAKAKLLAG